MRISNLTRGGLVPASAPSTSEELPMPDQDLHKIEGLMTFARTKDRLVYEHRQGQVLDVGQPGPWGISLKGYCVAMSVEWCRLRLSNEDFDYDFRRKKLDGPPVHILALHRRIDTVGVAQVLAELNLLAGAATACRLRPTWERLSTHLAANGLYIVTFASDTDPTGHVVAFEMQASDVNKPAFRFFDPNYGHFLFDSRRIFDAFMTNFLNYGYAAFDVYNHAWIQPVSWSGVTTGKVAALKQKFGG
jgi:hypothetical protein